MKVMAFNGSPRKDWNTATLLGKVLEGAAARGAEVEMIHLYDLAFTGCTSCFACKTKGGKSYARCAARDGLTPVLARAAQADALVLGSPVYLACVTGEMKSFMERLLFPYLAYDKARSSLFPGKVRAAFVYTMNVTEAEMKERGYTVHIDSNARFLERVFGNCEILTACDTWQFADYGRVVSDYFDTGRKIRSRQETFPADCAAAARLGERLVSA
ncbi:flavodoxin family protein [Oleispirillum naphthae]|uniref:flavodoxin family protein n=1 Tax=Oleispirillum naphthae TaxID=2838853 RepID=UPI0030824749